MVMSSLLGARPFVSDNSSTTLGDTAHPAICQICSGDLAPPQQHKLLDCHVRLQVVKRFCDLWDGRTPPTLKLRSDIASQVAIVLRFQPLFFWGCGPNCVRRVEGWKSVCWGMEYCQGDIAALSESSLKSPRFSMRISGWGNTNA